MHGDQFGRCDLRGLLWGTLLLNCIDLFAGAGGFSLGAKKAGLNLVLAIEYNKHAAATYRRNFLRGASKPVLLEGDIRKMSPYKIASEVLKQQISCDLLLGGPPCQGFSTHRLNDAGVDDERNDLIHTYFDFVRAFSPKMFLMENVPGMLWQRHEAALRRFYREGTKAGYRISKPVVLDARDYGVPQRRKRVFILGIRDDVAQDDLVWPPPPTHGNDKQRKLRPSLKPWVRCQPAFKRAPKGDINNIHMQHSLELVEAFKKTPPNGGSRKDSGRVLRCHSEHDGHKDVYGRIDPRLPAPTMTTACINPSKGRFVHPTLHHGITVRQAARIQTFPDNFIFEGGLTAAGEQVGNAVPVALAQHLIEHLKPYLMSPAKRISPRKESHQREFA